MSWMEQTAQRAIEEATRTYAGHVKQASTDAEAASMSPVALQLKHAAHALRAGDSGAVLTVDELFRAVVPAGERRGGQ